MKLLEELEDVNQWNMISFMQSCTRDKYNYFVRYRSRYTLLKKTLSYFLQIEVETCTAVHLNSLILCTNLWSIRRYIRWFFPYWVTSFPRKEYGKHRHRRSGSTSRLACNQEKKWFPATWAPSTQHRSWYRSHRLLCCCYRAFKGIWWRLRWTHSWAFSLFFSWWRPSSPYSRSGTILWNLGI